MTLTIRLALGAALAALSMTNAFASDLISYPTSTAGELPVHDTKPFDWSGFYAGLYGVAQNSSTDGGQYGLGINLGANTTFDFYLVGAEVALQGLNGDSGGATSADILARGGLLVNDDVLVYAAAGYGADTSGTADSNFLLGAGAEFAVTDNVSLRAQYLHGFQASGGNETNQVSLGANFHF